MFLRKIVAIIIASTVITSCDYVTMPYPKNTTAGNPDLCDTVVFPVVTVHTRKVLLEEFT